MRRINVQTVNWLEKNAPFQFWANLYFPGHRYGHYTSNIAESLNACLLKARELPIIPMLETIRQQLMEWYTKRRELEKNTQGKLVSKVAKEIQTKINERASCYRYFRSNEIIFEVKSGITNGEYLVNLSNRSCSCREWQFSGVPWAHALSVICGNKKDPQDFVDKVFSLEHHKNTYVGTIYHPKFTDYSAAMDINENGYLKRKRLVTDGASDLDEDEEGSDSEVAVLPPKTRRKAGQPGRLEKQRKKGFLEKSRRITKCSTFSREGHTKRKC